MDTHLNDKTNRAPDTPFQAGYAAGKAGKDCHKANPYKSHQREWKRFVNGFQTAQLEVINARPLPAWAEAQEALQ